MFATAYIAGHSTNELADKIAPLLNTSRETKQALLEILDPFERLTRVFKEMDEESEVRKLEKKLKDQVRKTVGTTHRDHYLNDQLKAIQKELGQTDEGRDDFEEYDKQIEDAKMPESVMEVAKKELRKLRMMSPMSAEANVGTIGNILQIMRLPNGTLKALYESKSRGRVISAFTYTFKLEVKLALGGVEFKCVGKPGTTTRLDANPNRHLLPEVFVGFDLADFFCRSFRQLDHVRN